MTDYVTNYEEAVELLYRIPRFNPNHSLEQIKIFLTRMGQPDKQMRFVHIAGTNGKGSTSAYLAGLLEQCGLKVGLFTSPHLVDVRERFQINGQMISRKLFVEAVQNIQLLLHQESAYTPCYFDMIFFIGMYAFRKERVDMVVLETGLGGRLDATNAVCCKELTLITHIALDHTEYLGETVEEIAAEKAGIMMTGAPCVVAAHNEAVVPIFVQKAAELDTTCRILDKGDYSCHGVSKKAVAFSYFSGYYGSISMALQTKALFQADNAALALAGLEALIERGLIDKDALTEASIGSSLWQVQRPGRMEELRADVFVDGAHNPDGVQAFLASVQADGCKGRRILIFSAVADKNVEEMAHAIERSGLFEQIILTVLPDRRGMDLAALLQCFQEKSRIENMTQGAEDMAERPYILQSEPDIAGALKQALQLQKEQDYVYIAGSLYLVGHVKKALDGKEQI